jgi:hypothetical protein
MAAVTRLDVTLRELVEIATAAVGGEGVQIIDGPYVGELSADVLLLGLPDGNQPGYRATVTRQQGYGRPRLTEEWLVHSMLSLTTGTNDVASLRERGALLLALLDEQLRDRVKVDDVWDRAGLEGQMDWVPLLGPSGASVTILFDIAGSALL